MRTIGLMSDTNGAFDRQYVRFFRDCDEIWHCGGIGDRKTLASILAMGKRILVARGDLDRDPLFERSFRSHYGFSVEGVRFLLVHRGVDNTLSSPAVYPSVAEMAASVRPDCIVCGHTGRHMDGTVVMPGAEGEQRRVRVLNPGVSMRGAGLQTVMRMKVDAGRIVSVERMEIACGRIRVY